MAADRDKCPYHDECMRHLDQRICAIQKGHDKEMADLKKRVERDETRYQMMVYLLLFIAITQGVEITKWIFTLVP